eukprot:COSAG01_NODE_405_length_17466_cov_554.403697_16_plen_94_part_00
MNHGMNSSWIEDSALFSEKLNYTYSRTVYLNILDQKSSLRIDSILLPWLLLKLRSCCGRQTVDQALLRSLLAAVGGPSTRSRSSTNGCIGFYS